MDDEQRMFRVPDGEAMIGQSLEKARNERGLTLEEVECATKIRKRYLVGLERGDYGELPGAVYARGFLKTYANYLGLDGEELSQELKVRKKPRRERGVSYGAPKTSEFDRPLVNPGQLGPAQGGRKSTSGTTMLILLVALLALAAVGTLYYVGRGVQISGENPAPSPPSEEKQQAADGSKQEAGGAPQAEKEKEEAANGGAGDSEAAGDGEPQPDTLTVVVSVEGSPSWLSILADGNLRYEQIAQPGFSQTFEAQREISIRTGNAGAVGVEVNGQDLGKLGEYGEVLTREFTLKTAT